MALSYEPSCKADSYRLDANRGCVRIATSLQKLSTFLLHPFCKIIGYDTFLSLLSFACVLSDRYRKPALVSESNRL